MFVFSDHFRNYENKSLTELNQEFDKELSMMLDSVSMKPESLLNATAVIKKFYFKNALVTKGQEKNVCDVKILFDDRFLKLI